ncbi:MAG: oligopeptide transporter, OPT family [Bdellovibrionota bacterium]
MTESKDSSTVFTPYVSAEDTRPETTARAIGVGILMGIVFGAANAYLGLRVGLTIATSIPIAVLSVMAFMALPPFGKIASVLETNMSQTIGSASSSLASGMIFTIPALFLWGFKPSFIELLAVSITGGLLGVLFMVPLRKLLIRDEHEQLPYPEGTACAKVMIAAEKGGAGAKPIFYGILTGGLVKLFGGALKLWQGEFSFNIPFLPKAQLGFEVSPALLGVGYILGMRVSTIMVAGGLLAWLVIIPTLAIWGQGQTQPLYPEMMDLIIDMSPGKLWTRYVRYIGAGAVAMAGIITLIKSIPMIIQSFKIGFQHLVHKKIDTQILPRTDQDLSMKTVLLGVVILILFLALSPFVFSFLPSITSRIVCALLVGIFAFFFVTVSSRIVGLVGVTSNPTSGMTIGTLLAVSGLMLLFGWSGPQAMAQALVIGAIVATAASIAGDTSQDLKSGYILGATPRKQQIGELIGVVTAASFVVLSLFILAKAYGFGGQELPAPQAVLMKLVIEGVMSQNLPWNLVAIGAAISVVAAILRVPTLAFAVGIYLPVATLTPVFLGGLLRWYLERKAQDTTQKNHRRERGILFGSGLVGGEGLLGVAIAGYALLTTSKPKGIGSSWAGLLEEWIPLIILVGLMFLLYKIATKPEQSE